MAAPPPTVADLQALIQMLKAQVAALQAALPAAPAAGAAHVALQAVPPSAAPAAGAAQAAALQAVPPAAPATSAAAVTLPTPPPPPPNTSHPPRFTAQITMDEATNKSSFCRWTKLKKDKLKYGNCCFQKGIPGEEERLLRL